MSEDLKDFLVDRVVSEGLVKGAFSFNNRSFFSEHRIETEALYSFKEGWSNLAADLLLEVPTAGLVGIVQDGRHWIRAISKVLEERGVELPTTEIENSMENFWGVPLSNYPSHPVTIFGDITTLGHTLDHQIGLIAKEGVLVDRAIVLIDRNPSPLSHTPNERVSISSVIHFPLPLYGSYEQVLYSESGFLPPLRRFWRDINTFPLLS